MDDILVELKKPKSEQKLTEDFFIEMERSLKTVERSLPQAFPGGDKDKARQILIKKFRSQVIDNRVHFRNLPKIARAKEVPEAKRLRALRNVFADNTYSLKSAYDDSVAELYTERDILTRVSSLYERIVALGPEDLDDLLKQRLKALEKRIHALLEEADAL